MEEEINNEKNQTLEVEVMEFNLDSEDIDELVAKLQLLKETKEQIAFDVDDENSFLINYDEGEEE